MFAFLKKNKKSKLDKKKYLRYLSIMFLAGVSIFIGMFAYAAVTLPKWDPTKLTSESSTLIYDDQGAIVSRLHSGENRIEVTYDKIPKDLIYAFIATEDQDFYKHHGVNYKGIARALINNVTSGDLKGQGASTITQQLARNAFLSLDKKWERKVKEIILAFKIESEFSKEEIMTFYLNEINFGAGAYGVQSAANIYFNKDVSKLNLAESSLLAGLVQSPTNYNPLLHLDRAKARHKAVLNNMVKCNFITEKQATEAYNEKLNFSKSTPEKQKKYGYFIDAVVDEAINVLSASGKIDNPESAIYSGGMKIYTTMDAKVQRQAEEVYKNAGNFPNQTNNGKPIQSAMVVIKNSDGGVKALIGGREYTHERGFNRATSALRQPGSAIKPITVYAPALEKGKMPFAVYDDSPLSYKTNGPNWEPKNYDLKYRGLITMRTAVQWSINTYAVQCVDDIGIRTSFDFGRNMGLPLIDKPGTNDLSLAPLALGGLSEGVTPLQMAAAYATFGNNGVYAEPHLITKIVDQKGVVKYEFKPTYKKVMSEETAWLMTNLMQTVVSAGTGTRAQIPGVPTAGKTGTSEELTNAWFCGLTPQYAAAVWLGFDEQQKPMHNVFGGDAPARIFKSVLQKAHENTAAGNFTMPANIIKVSVCSKDGKLPANICPQDRIISEYCVKGFAPTETSNIYKLVTICDESGKLANEYCPHTSEVPRLNISAYSTDPEKIPTETCDIHLEREWGNIDDLFDPENDRFSPMPDDSDYDDSELDTDNEAINNVPQEKKNNSSRQKKNKEVIIF
jgi:penicillin-binding protein 1A